MGLTAHAGSTYRPGMAHQCPNSPCHTVSRAPGMWPSATKLPVGQLAEPEDGPCNSVNGEQFAAIRLFLQRRRVRLIFLRQILLPWQPYGAGWF